MQSTCVKMSKCYPLSPDNSQRFIFVVNNHNLPGSLRCKYSLLHSVPDTRVSRRDIPSRSCRSSHSCSRTGDSTPRDRHPPPRNRSGRNTLPSPWLSRDPDCHQCQWGRAGLTPSDSHNLVHSRRYNRPAPDTREFPPPHSPRGSCHSPHSHSTSPHNNLRRNQRQVRSKLCRNNCQSVVWCQW